ncbi:MAG TPA: DUF4230 domain-containing protein [Flavilitoribacter sp.]|nr:DUF4230 domain-containing protein [Flavilitoribacter sp.]HMQ87217.1 DUF4230 domain-containing protein [Flavilitoribacter sp.]
MSKGSSSPKPASNIGIAKMLIVVLGVSILGVVGFRYLRNVAGFGADFTNVPKEYTLNYMPADFKMDIDEEDAIAILSNPERYRREFDQLVYQVNTSLLEHVARRMGLPDSAMTAIRAEYDNQHPYLRTLYYNDFIAARDTNSQLYETWYNNGGGSAVAALNEVASKYTCFLVTQIISSVIKTKEGTFFARGRGVDNPCSIASNEALQPFMKKLEDRAKIDDFSRSKGLLEEKVEKVIAELGTYELRDKKGISKQMQTKIWGMNVSSSDLEITAISILKVGFRLQDYFDISLNSKAGIVTITLPEPTVLSHEVYPKIDKLDIGWLREVKSINFNESFNTLREEFRREAIYEDNVMDKARKQAIELMNTMFSPLISSMSSKYQLRVKFKQGEKEAMPEWDESGKEEQAAKLKN